MRLKTWLKLRKINRIEFAQKVGISTTHLSRICSGYDCSPDTGRRIVEESNSEVTFDDLYRAAPAGDAA